MRTGVLGGACVAAVLWMNAAGVASQQPPDGDLVTAAKQRNAAAVRALLQKHVPVDTPAGDGATALHWAVRNDELAIAQLLLEAGANVNAANRWGVTPLSVACVNGSAAAVELLLKAGADVNAVQTSGETALMTAARTGNLAVVSRLLDAGATVNHRMPGHGQTALMWAAAERHAGVARALIARGADVDVRSNNGYTALMFAGREGDSDSARLLMDAGTDVNLASKDGFTALLLATVRGHVETAALLLEYGADPNADGPGYTALHWASGSWWTRLTGEGGIRLDGHPEWRAVAGLPGNKLDFIRTLVDYGADPNARVKKTPDMVGGFAGGDSPPPMNGATAFWLAAYAADVDVMRALADGGADTKAATAQGITPLMAAAGVGRVLGVARITDERALAATTLALSLGSDINATTRTGDSALHGAAACRATPVVKFLLDRGAELNARNKAGFTATDAAELTTQGGGGLIKQHSSLGDLLRSLGGVEGAPEHVVKRVR